MLMMLRVKKLKLVALFLGCASVLQAKPPVRFDFNSRVGVADSNERGGLCLIIANASLKEGTSLSLVVLSKQQRVLKARVKQRLNQSCSYNPDTGNSSFYSLVLEDEGTFKYKDLEAFAVAVISTTALKVKQGRASGDLDRDGQKEFFRECTSHEGLHLTVWSGRPLYGRRRWHFYYYLGYDVVPSCKKKDV
jgi:hypothetical protein